MVNQIIVCELTTPEMHVLTVVTELLAQIDTPFDNFVADATYDGTPVSQVVLSYPSVAQVIVPPHNLADLSPAGDKQLYDHLQVPNRPIVLKGTPDASGFVNAGSTCLPSVVVA